MPKEEASHKLPAPLTNIANLYPAIYIDESGPCKYCGADSILNASIKISCVELNIAKDVIDIVINIKFSAGSVIEVKINEIMIINCVKSNHPLLCPNFSKKGIPKLSTIGDHRYLNAYAKPTQLKRVTVLLLIPALNSQTDKVENTKSIGNPDENPKNNIFNVLFLKKM